MPACLYIHGSIEGHFYSEFLISIPVRLLYSGRDKLWVWNSATVT